MEQEILSVIQGIEMELNSACAKYNYYADIDYIEEMVEWGNYIIYLEEELKEAKMSL